MINVELLKKVCETPGVSGYEQKIRAFVAQHVTPFADEVYTDHMGNLIVFKRGKSSEKRVMCAAHMDEIGFIVSHIDDDGFLRFQPLGGFDPKTLTAQRVIVHGKNDIIGVMGTKPIHLMTNEERDKKIALCDFFIDLGMKRGEVTKYIEVGNPVTRERGLIEMGDCINCKSLDNRISVFVLMETLREIIETETPIPYDFYAVFTVQEEVGIRGAWVAAHHINPDFSIGLDTTIAFDTPDAKPEERVTRLGEGTAIKIMDASTICDYRMVRYMKTTAVKHNIKWQSELLPAGGTDTAGMQRMATNGTIAGAISIPTRHIHSVIEMCNKADVRASIDLLKVCVAELDTFDWSFA